MSTPTETTTWSRKKKDPAPRGVFRHPSGVWAARFTCGAGHVHERKVGLKGDANRLQHDSRLKAHKDPTWCPNVERQAARAADKVQAAHERARVTFGEYAPRYLAWAKDEHRSYTTTRGQVEALTEAFRDTKLDAITPADVEGFLSGLRDGDSPSERKLTPATINRYRDRLSGMFRQAARWGLVSVNPVKGIAKAKEPGGRIAYLPPATKDRPAYEEDAVRAALPADLRPLFLVSVHTGLRWSEQVGLRWRDVDVHAGVITVPRSKNGATRHVQVNAVVRSVLFDLSLQRERPSDPSEPVFTCRYTAADKFFPKAVQQARDALRRAEKDAARLEGYTWHGNRHTFASRLVMAGVDLLSVQKLGGWKTLSMVQRYAHLAPDHLRAAVERLVPQDLENTWTGPAAPQAGVSYLPDAPVAQLDRASDF